jgi:hypothetical protein
MISPAIVIPCGGALQVNRRSSAETTKIAMAALDDPLADALLGHWSSLRPSL